MRPVSLCLPAPQSPKKETLINTPSDHLRLDSPSSHAPAPFTYTVLHYNKPLSYHLPVSPCSVCDRRSDQHRHSPMDPRPSVPSVALEELVTTLQASLQPPPSPQSASASPKALPAAYAGEAAECGGFLLQLALYIEMQPQKFLTERSKVAFLISLLSGRALSWARAIWNANTSLINSYCIH